jgi:hypothetical protein
MVRSTDTPMVIALNVPGQVSPLNVRGRLQKKQSKAMIAENPTVHKAEFESVFKSSAPTRQWSAVSES